MTSLLSLVVFCELVTLSVSTGLSVSISSLVAALI
jgi:hypothetical protein